MIFVNFKTYEGGSGEKVLTLVKIIEEASSSSGISIIPAVQLIDAPKVILSTGLSVWAQYLEKPVQELFALGLKGTFLNHSDHKYQNLDELGRDVENCKKAGLTTMVFADNLEELKKVLVLKPDYVSYEPPELIASKETSVSMAKPEVIAEVAKFCKEAGIPLIVGAGIKSKEDVVKSLELGASGVAVSSAVVKAQDPKAALLELTEGFQ